jgi:outer membrane protein assembly factor BamE (lipoprotein component of BamABCDE complex)
MSDGGKGSRPRPLSVTQEQYDNRWDYIFSRDKSKPADVEDNTGVDKNEYQDVLSTEDCLVDKK